MISSLAVISKAFFGVRGLVCLILICFSQLIASAQQSKDLLVPPDSSWGKEVFSFPLTFAPAIKYRGFEEAWFPKAWSKKDSESFWSYCFAWSLDSKEPISLKDIKQNLRNYFDGLMNTKIAVSTKGFPPTIVSLRKSTRTNHTFVGTLKIFDAFTLKSPLILYINIQQVFSKNPATLVVIFRLSPKPPEHSIWKQLNGIEIKGNH